MKRLCLLFFMLPVICGVQVCAQGLTSKKMCQVVGIVADQATNEPEPMATVCVMHRGLSAAGVKKVLADSAGRFMIQLPVLQGEYDITTAMIGRKAVPQRFTLAQGDSLKGIGYLYLADDVKMLQGVEVVAQKPLVMMDVDKLTYDVASDPDAKVLRLSEMMNKVPLINVDADGNIEMNGTKKFLILQNGRKTAITRNPKDILRSLPAEMVKRIEVITSPGARYDAEGIGGVINIVMHSQYEGHLTDLSADANTQGYNLSASTMSKIGRLAFDGSFSFNRIISPTSTTCMLRDNYSQTAMALLKSEESEDQQGNTEFAMFNASYEIDSVQMVTFSLVGMGSQQRTMSDELTGMWNRDYSQTAYSYLRHGTFKNSLLNGSINLDYQRQGRRNPQRMTTLSYQLSTNPSRDRDVTQYADIVSGGYAGLIENLQLYDNRTDRHNKTNEHTLQYDYTAPLGNQHLLEVGAKYILRNNESQNDLYDRHQSIADWTYNSLRSNHYKNRNDILGAYVSYTYRGRVLSFVPGLRYEYTYQDIKYLAGPIGSEANYSSHYANVVPSVKLNFKLAKSQSLRLEYSMRLSRPSIYYLNPYFNNLNPQNIVQGNSSLDAERSYTLGATYGWFTRKTNLSVTVNYRNLNNGIESYSRLIGPDGEYFDDGKHYAAPGAIYTTYLNVGQVQRTALSLYYKWSVSNRLWLTLSGSTSYIDLRAPSRQLYNHGWCAEAGVMVSWMMPAGFSLFANISGRTRDITLQGRSDGICSQTFSLSHALLRNQRLRIALRAINPFSRWLNRDTHTVGAGFESTSFRHYSRQMFGIGISYRIGDMKYSKTKRSQHSIYNGDLKREPLAD